MGAIGKLHQNHPHIPCHRHKHLTETLSLRFGMTLKLELIELG
jgi:hypothetical protein